jgi:hypothetical protein
VITGDLPQSARQALVFRVWRQWLFALRGTVLPRDTARAAL